MSVYEAVNRGHDRMFALKRKEENISTENDELKSMGRTGDPFTMISIA